jgi:ribose transport system substrate-binding protein
MNHLKHMGRISAAAAMLTLGMAACGASSSSSSSSGVCTPSQVKLVLSIRTLSNPYQGEWAKGAQEYANSVHLKLDTLVDNGDSLTERSLLEAVVAGGGHCVVVNLDPNTDSDTLPDVKLLTAAGAYVVTQWSLPENVYPWNVSNHWITSIAPNGLTSGYNNAKILFKAMGEQGNIVALQGILDGLPEQQRWEGLQKALQETPGIHLLAYQSALWNLAPAYTDTEAWLAKYPGQIGGVWAANDNMALGALSALQASGITASETKVVGTADAVPQALSDISAGTDGYLATTDSSGYWQGGVGLALGYMAATGTLNVDKMPHSERLAYTAETTVTSANVQSFLTLPSQKTLVQEWKNPFKLFTGPVTFPAYSEKYGSYGY